MQSDNPILDAVPERPVWAAMPGLTGKLQLIGISGIFKNRIMEMNPDQWIIIGRDAHSCQLVYPPNFGDISRRHCKVMYDPVGLTFIVVDLFSSNGTFRISGERLDMNRHCYFHPGERFYLSNSSNTFEFRIYR